jgi:histidinol-phosphate aminotransferase
LPAYTLRAYEAEIKLNQNESPYDFPADLKDEVFRRFRGRAWSRYPDFSPAALQQGLARLAGWQEKGILIGNGSNELIQATLMVLLGGRSSVTLPSPTFTVYELVSNILGARISTVALTADMAFDAPSLLAQSERVGSKMIVLATPNNPTGSVLSEAGLQQILEEFPGYVLLDEAYFEFCGVTGLKFLTNAPRLIITRTFSKAMGMAGLRIGYLMTHPELAAQIAKAKLPYNVNQFSLTAAAVALENYDRFRPAIASILEEKERLGAVLGAIPGIRVYPSGANFFLFQVPSKPAEVFDQLYRQGILVRDVSSYPMLSRCLRVSIGTREENDRFLAALQDCFDHERPSMHKEPK